MYDERLIPIGEVSMLLHVSPRAIHKWLSSGKFPRPLRLGRVLRWRMSDIKRFLDCGADIDVFEREAEAAAARR